MSAGDNHWTGAFWLVVAEVWKTQEDHTASLTLASVQEAIQQGRLLSRGLATALKPLRWGVRYLMGHFTGVELLFFTGI